MLGHKPPHVARPMITQLDPPLPLQTPKGPIRKPPAGITTNSGHWSHS
jgi:hypothetical protein